MRQITILYVKNLKEANSRISILNRVWFFKWVRPYLCSLLWDAFPYLLDSLTCLSPSPVRPSDGSEPRFSTKEWSSQRFRKACVKPKAEHLRKATFLSHIHTFTRGKTEVKPSRPIQHTEPFHHNVTQSNWRRKKKSFYSPRLKKQKQKQIKEWGL